MGWFLERFSFSGFGFSDFCTPPNPMGPIVIFLNSYMKKIKCNVIVRLYIDQVEWYRKDGDSVQKGLQFGKVHGE